MSAVLILEDNDDKVENIIMKMKDSLHNKPVMVARSVAQAQEMMSLQLGLWTLFIDYELMPGCGNGLEFLEWLRWHHVAFIEQIFITSFSLEYNKVMCRYCEMNQLPWEKYK